MSAKFPRAPDANPVVIAGDVWNDLVEAVEWIKKLRVTAPLEYHDTPGGPLISGGGGPARIFPVNLVSDGGDSGDETGPATWTYTVSTLSGSELGTTMSPQKRLPGALNAGSFGLGYYNEAGTFVLWDTNETVQTTECTTPP